MASIVALSWRWGGVVRGTLDEPIQASCEIQLVGSISDDYRPTYIKSTNQKEHVGDIQVKVLLKETFYY